MHFQNLTQKEEFPNILFHLLKYFGKVEPSFLTFIMLNYQSHENHLQLLFGCFLLLLLQ